MTSEITKFEEFEQFKQILDVFGGYITQPELRYFENGKAKCTFAIPLKKNKDDEAKWLNCEAWGRYAEIAGELKKGDEVLVFGYFKESQYKDKEGKEKTNIVFIVKGVL
jgi:single-stranded DNA-binding protein